MHQDSDMANYNNLMNYNKAKETELDKAMEELMREDPELRDLMKNKGKQNEHDLDARSDSSNLLFYIVNLSDLESDNEIRKSDADLKDMLNDSEDVKDDQGKSQISQPKDTRTTASNRKDVYIDKDHDSPIKNKSKNESFKSPIKKSTNEVSASSEEDEEIYDETVESKICGN